MSETGLDFIFDISSVLADATATGPVCVQVVRLGAETSCRREAPVETVASLVSFLSVSLGFGTLFEADRAAWRQRLFECQVPIHTDHTLD